MYTVWYNVIPAGALSGPEIRIRIRNPKLYVLQISIIESNGDCK